MGKAEKQQKNQQNAKLADYILRRDQLGKEINELSRKYKIDLIPVITWENNGAFPVIAFKDMIEHYNKITEEAAKQNEAERVENPTEAPAKLEL